MDNASSVFKSTPTKLRAKLSYNTLEEIQPELAGLFCGTGAQLQPASFAFFRKYICVRCAFIAINPKILPEVGLLCSPCQELFTEKQQANFLDINRDGIEEMDKNLLFKCIFGCGTSLNLRQMVVHLR